jgi:hypothetical protein
VLQSLMNKGAFQTKTDSFIRKKKYRAFVIPPPSSHDEIKTASYTISNDVRKEYEQWHMTVRNLSQMTLQQPKWKPPVNWTNHPRDRSHRFPSVEERVPCTDVILRGRPSFNERRLENSALLLTYL